MAADEFDLVLLVGQARGKPELDALDLLRYGTEDSLLKTVELVKAAPSANLTQADEDASHRLEVEGLVATEDEYETSERDAERFDGLRFTCSADEMLVASSVLRAPSETITHRCRLDQRVSHPGASSELASTRDSIDP